MNQPGYEQLANILTAAFNQAAVGKGAERHAGGQPFDQQPMQSISDLFDTPYGMAFQVAKKLHEGIKMDTLERQERELLGVIVYTAGIILWLRRQNEKKTKEVVLHASQPVADLVNDLRAAGFTTSSAVHDDLGDSWIQWHGGECPVPVGTRVEIKLRNPYQKGVLRGFAENLRWSNDKEWGDIIAYRLVKKS